MRNYHILFLTLFVLLFITGCTTLRPTSDGRQTGDPLIGSPSGIEIKFLPEQPPSELFEGSDFIIVGLELKNNAACNAIGKLCITDSTPVSRGGITDTICSDFNVPGAYYENNKPKIENEKINFQIPPYKNLEILSELPVVLEATATYKCRVASVPQFCVKSTTEEDRLCSSSETITGSRLNARAAPITVTKVVKKFNRESGGVRLVTDITLSKMNKGYLSNQESLENPLLITKEDFFNVQVDFEGNTMDCIGKDFRDGKLYWKIDDKDKTIRCNALVSVVEKIDPGHLNVNLDYVYKITESKSIKIIKLTQNV